MIDALAKGDEVATAGGIIGKVTRLSEGFLHIEIANNVEVQIQRSAVVQVLPKGYGEVKSLKSGRGGGGRRQPSSGQGRRAARPASFP